MVVVPTSTHVRLVYEASRIDLGAYVLSLIGLLGLGLLWWRGPLDFGPGDWWEPYPDEPDPFGVDEPSSRPSPPGDASPGTPSPLHGGSPSPTFAPYDDDPWAPPSPALVVDPEDALLGLPEDPTAELARPSHTDLESLDGHEAGQGVPDRVNGAQPPAPSDPPRLAD
jgi:hypothetical protein